MTQSLQSAGLGASLVVRLCLTPPIELARPCSNRTVFGNCGIRTYSLKACTISMTINPLDCARVLAGHITAAGIAWLMMQPVAMAALACPVIDATVTLTQVATASSGKPDADQLAAYQHGVIDAWPGLYRQDVIGLAPGAAMDRQILRSLASVRADGDRVELKHLLGEQIGAVAAAFGAFGDFKCNFPIYFADMLGQLDGAGRVVDGRRALVLGLDALERERGEILLQVFLTHEFFHRYHFEAAGFSDDLEDRQEIWRTLWAEGLATYMSKVLSPSASTGDALMLPKDLAQRAQPLTARMAAELLQGLDGMDANLFRRYFTSNPNIDRNGVPPRAGYYIGYVIAQRLAAHHSLSDLAHLRGDSLHREMVATLRELAHSK
jgi:hypothetical protein